MSSDVTTPAHTRLGLGRAASTEWLKLRTVRSTWWLVAGLAVILVSMALLDTDAPTGGVPGSQTTALNAVSYFGQYLVAALGMLVITAEFASRSITVTLACTPSRTRVMLAKALVIGVAGFALGAVTTCLGILVGAVRLGELDDLTGSVVRQVLGTGVYLGLLAVISLGLGTVVKRTAGALAIVIVFLLVVPELLAAAARRWNLSFLETLAGWTPAQAGWRVMTGDWEYVAALVGWAVLAVGAGIWLLRRRDA